MDEPLSNLDAQLRQQMRGEIRELQQRLGITMLYVTHDQTEAMTMADRVVLMRAGRIEQQGTPQDLYERPASTFVAGFIGAPAMNLFADPDPTRRCTLGVRPEQIVPCPPGEGLAARVLAVEYLGAESLLVCEAGPADDRARIVLRTGGHAPMQRGDAIGLTWPAHALHRFDRDSGLRLT
jgi:sn-glycerol 3-phosphate transport system ATP-binding protein